jgi:predicted nuclease of predicted toxin-antitoxin system
VPKILVIDENLDSRIAAELKSRGRDAVSVKDLGLTTKLDEELLWELSMRLNDWVLVTADDRMPFEHPEAIMEVKATIATIDGEWEKCCAKNNLHLNQQQFQRETIQRWAHQLSDQASGTLRRYSPVRNSVWTTRRKYYSR